MNFHHSNESIQLPVALPSIGSIAVFIHHIFSLKHEYSKIVILHIDHILLMKKEKENNDSTLLFYSTFIMDQLFL